jgi:hypothetical protein
MKPDFGAYLESWTNELYSRADRVRQLIGDAHWLSDGHHKEGIIREFLARHLPPNLNIHRGFVRTVGGSQQCSPENDILISDFSAHPPYFFEGDLQIVPPSSVVAHLEIKTAFGKTAIKDALLNVVQTRRILRLAAKFEKTWSGIYFFQNDRATDSFHETVETAIKEIFNESGGFEFDSQFIEMLPKCITNVSGSITFIHAGELNEIKLRTFKLGRSSLPCSFFDLMGSVRSYLSGPAVTDFDDMLSGLDIEPPAIAKFKLR